MVKSTHVSFPREGVSLHISAEDAVAYGINPGEPAVVEVTVRDHTVEEWIAEASTSAFETGAEEGDSSSGVESDPPAVAAEPSAGSAVEDHPRISWTSAAKPTASAAKPIDSAAAEEPIATAEEPFIADEEPTRISWRTSRLAASDP